MLSLRFCYLYCSILLIELNDTIGRFHCSIYLLRVRRCVKKWECRQNSRTKLGVHGFNAWGRRGIPQEEPDIKSVWQGWGPNVLENKIREQKVAE